jgi:hypothetical protein
MARTSQSWGSLSTVAASFYFVPEINYGFEPLACQGLSAKFTLQQQQTWDAFPNSPRDLRNSNCRACCRSLNMCNTLPDDQPVPALQNKGWAADFQAAIQY